MSNNKMPITAVEGIDLRRLRYILTVSPEDAAAGNNDVTKYSQYAKMLNFDIAHESLQGLTTESKEEMKIWVQQMGSGVIQRLIDEISLAPVELRGVSTLVALHSILAILSACVNDYVTIKVFQALLEEQLKTTSQQAHSLLQVRGLYNLAQMIGLDAKELKEWEDVEFNMFKETLAEVIRRKNSKSNPKPE